MNIANWLTIGRIILVPAVVISFYLPWNWSHQVASSIFAISAITDLFDGYLARNLHQVTRFGTFLDPIADKLVVAVSLVLIVAELGRWYVAIPAAIIIGRELAVSGLREWMAELGRRSKLAVTWLTKVKTAIQMVAIWMLLYYHPRIPYNLVYLIFGLILLYLAAFITIWSMFRYLRAAWPFLSEKMVATSNVSEMS